MKRGNRRWKDILLGAVGMALVSCMVVPVLAYSGTRNETLTYNDIKVELDGTRLTLRDGDGTVVEPFIIDGTTYLPVRAIAEALGLNVTWNGQTETVSLTTGSGTATGDNTGSTSTGEYIGEEKAKTIALDHAGVSASNATFIRVQLGRDDGRMEYEVEFWSGKTEYDYDIDALTGDIRSYDRDVEGYTIPSSQTGTDIGESKAKSIALDHAGVKEANTVFLQVQRDYDDGRLVYDVEFYADSREYDYEIDASSGTILSYDYDAERYTPSQSGDYIGETRAKEIALSQSGVSENDATFIKCKLDFDDGRAIYDVEFRKGWTEYSFEIDAVSGTVLERDVDWD